MPLKTHQDEQPQLNLTPMIDVLFLLIMFFMVAARFNDMERNIEVQVPQVAEAGDAVSPPQPRVINVFADGRIDLDGLAVTLSELTTRLAAAHTSSGDPSVIVRGDAACPFQHVASALGACRAAKISDLGITVRTADGDEHTTVR
ncbi:MAG TPA: biopolymer transporter ExbD [Lacipirellulaceae bacterium]|jgi:biopolymer transport protein ExbD